MNRVRLTHPWSVTLVSTLLATACLSPVFAQKGELVTGPRPPRGKPFVGTNAPMPKEVTLKPLKKSRAGGVTAGTIDITPNTPLVTDGSPFWSKDENSVFFHSNRSNLAGTTAGTLFHIYRMSPTGATVTAVTGPLASPVVGGTSSQTEPALSTTGTQLVYVETSATGTVDLVEYNLSTKQTKSLVKNNAQYQFVALSGPEYGAWTGMNAAVIFAGKVGSTTAPFKLFAVDTQSGVIAPVTTGISDDRNPTVSPASGTTQSNSVIAFDSNRADPRGTSTKATRDIWVIPIVNELVPARRVTDFSVNGQASNNIYPAWSTNKVDANGFVNGLQLLAFSSTRVDTANDGNPTAISANGSHDVYWLKVTIGLDPTDPDNPGFTVLTPESATNAALKLPTGDPNHVYDDLCPSWPQFIATYRVAFQSNRTAYDGVNQVSQPAVPTAATPTDIFTSTLLDVNAPGLVRFDETSGEVLKVEPRLASPGTPVRITAKLVDLETGIRDVWVQIKNPNSKYQSSDGREHKVFIGAGMSLGSNNIAMQIPVEYEHQRIFVGSDPSDPRRNTYANPRYMASQADYYAFSGDGNAPDPGWLRMNLESRDPVTGVGTYSATWTTDAYPSDYYIDVIAYDNAVDPFSSDSINWKIYDNVWGFSTQSFQAAAHGILFVSDYASGQKFFSSRFGTASLVNVNHTFWGTESWMTDIDVSLLPRSYINDTTVGSLVMVLNALGVGSYGAYNPRDPYTGNGSDGSILDGSRADGVDVPVTQQYDIWRILARGAVPDSVLAQYLPHVVQQPPDLIAGETTPRNVTVSNGCVIWHAPYTGTVFAGQGTLSDLQTQTQLSGFLKAGGRLLVNGQDIAWALTLDGAVSNAFLTNDLKAQFVRDDAGFTYFRTGGGGLMMSFGISGSYVLAGAGAYNPISHDPWISPPGKSVPNSSHTYYGPPFPPGSIDYISRDPNWVAAGDDSNNPRTYACPGNAYPDQVISLAGAVPDLTYGGGGTAVHHYLDPTSGSRLVYSPMGLEGLFPDWFNPPNTQNTIALKNRRSQLLHNFVCWARTGTISGTVLDGEGAGAPLADVLVRLSSKSVNGIPQTAYTAMTAADGSFFIQGVEPDDYEITAGRRGYTIQKRTMVVVHGYARDEISFRMTKAEHAVVQGKVTRTDGTTPVVGATLTLRDVLPPNETFTAVSDATGNYTISRVPSQTTYTLTCSAAGFGSSTPVSYPVPNPTDPLQTQRDTVVQPAKVYVGFDFRLKPEQGTATGRVLADATGQPISGAVVTATMGTQTVTAVTDGSGAYSFNKANTPANGLDAGTWGLVASAPGYDANSPAESIVVASNAATTAPDIRLKKVGPGSISGLVTRTSDSAAQAAVAVQVRDAAGNLIAETTTAAPTTVSGYTYNYKLNSVPAGVTYTVTVSAQGFTPVPTSRSAKVESEKETRNVNFQMEPLHTFSGGLSLMSMPYDYSAVDAADLLSIPAADRTNGTFLLATWDLRKYSLYPAGQAARFRSGRGYFLSYKNNIPLSTEGLTADTTRPFDITLNTGWNLIGNPFLFDLDWTKSLVLDNGALKSFTDAVSTGAIASALYTYVSGSYVLDYKLAPWRGYWVRAYRNVTLKLDPVTGQYGRSAATTSRAVLRGSQGWTVNLRADLAGLKDHDNRFGMASGAVDTFDGFKVEKPPVFGSEYVSLTFEHSDWGELSGGYGVDVRSASTAPRTWDVVVRGSTASGTGSLTWPDVANVPKSVMLTLTDLATGTARDMRSSSGYSWQSAEGETERRFRIDAAPVDRSVLRITDVRCTTTGRASGSDVTFALSAPATVTVRVMTAAGAPVRTLPAGATRAAGAQQMRWDQRDSKGVLMPAGVYQVEIKATSSDGKQSVRAISQVVVTR